MVKHAVLLAGGEGTRLRPFTYYTSKHLLPVFNRPMIFYPLMNLLLLGVKNICIIINKNHKEQWHNLFKGLKLPININIIIQENPEGIPHALKLCEKIIGNHHHYLSLGDNILLGSGMFKRFKEAVDKNSDSSVILGYHVRNPSDFGVVKYSKNGSVLKIIEKPKIPPSNMAIVGLYKFPPDAFLLIEKLKKSKRNEYEIADLINLYLGEKRCYLMESDSATDFWLDAGSIESLVSATNFLKELSVNGNIDLANLENFDFKVNN